MCREKDDPAKKVPLLNEAKRSMPPSDVFTLNKLKEITTTNIDYDINEVCNSLIQYNALFRTSILFHSILQTHLAHGKCIFVMLVFPSQMANVLDRIKRGESGWEADNNKLAERVVKYKCYIIGRKFFYDQLRKQGVETDSAEVAEFIARPSTYASLLRVGTRLKGLKGRTREWSPKDDQILDLANMAEEYVASKRAVDTTASWMTHTEEGTR